MAMPAMRTRYPILGLQVVTYTDGDCFLTYVQMNEPGQFTPLEMNLNRQLKLAQEHHLLIEAK